MNIICHNCHAKFTIPDHKVPRDKASLLKCPQCKEKIPIPAVQQQPSVGEKAIQPFPLSFKERLNALVCIDGRDVKNKAVSIIGQMGLNVETASDSNRALDKMEYHIYHLVIMDAAFDQNKGVPRIVDRMNTIDMSLRRKICLVLITSKFNTNDDMAALHFSVNYILHPDDILHLEPFLSKVLAKHKNFYTVYNDSLKLTGKA
ncbi:zinc-ribbon domain-containing protein [Desulfobacula sp.]|uniref:zinc-ribbon domain-containing protein n=1 Tax=Desulfobacula sp. TaxID=2593537 RepID=UPI00260F227A|nr:zinc-ribbon domain-containing protein [Desulfobacula sp.]